MDYKGQREFVFVLEISNQALSWRPLIGMLPCKDTYYYYRRLAELDQTS